MMQKKIKIHDKEKKIKNQRSTSINYQSKIIINNNEKHFLKTNNNNLNTSDFETNPIDSTITSDSTTTTDTTKRIYIYRKNISKQKSSLGVAKQNSKKNIKPLNHCTSTDNLNKNKKNTNRFNTLETLEYNNNCRENTINNDYFQKCDDKKINKINDTTPNRKYYKFNNYTINSGPNIFKKGTNLNKYFYNQQNFYNNSVQKIIKKNEVINIEDLLY